MYGEALYKPEMKEGNPIRLYSLDEITEIFGKLGLRICNSAYSARTAHPFQRNGAPFRFKLSKAQQVD